MAEGPASWLQRISRLMSHHSKTKGISWLLGLVAVMLFMGVLYLGPRLGIGEGSRVRAQSRLANGVELLLVQTRNSDPVEAYTVSVYTLWPNGEIDKCLVGFEESYWWRPSIVSSSTSSAVEICSGSTPLCTYEPSSGELTWLNQSYPVQRARRVPPGGVPQCIAKFQSESGVSH